MSDFKNKICLLADEYQSSFESMSTYLFDNPELGGEEFLSAKCIVNMLKKHNFVVNEPYETLPTAVVASYITIRLMKITHSSPNTMHFQVMVMINAQMHMHVGITG